MIFSIIGIFIYFFVALNFWSFRPASKLHGTGAMESLEGSRRRWWMVACLATILFCTLPMSLSPAWNGEHSDHRNQYEMMAEMMLKGQVFFDYQPNPELLTMENPYDFHARVENHTVDEYWDHAYYKGKFYMYFGVVPEVTLFLPYRFLTGQNLNTYHATQLYVALFIIGLFLMFGMLVRLYFRDMPAIAFYSLCVSFSIISVWYATIQPAMYCTAQSSAYCFMIWSLFCFMKAVLDTDNENRTISLSVLGGLLGALAFGCRPTIALANLMAIPLAFIFLKKSTITPKFIGKFFLIFVPYLVVGVALMWYNYIRFENPFEFGQTYQLTIADQTSYGNWISRMKWSNIWESIDFCLFQLPFFNKPTHVGLLLSFPIYLVSLFALLKRENWQLLHRHSLITFGLFGLVTVIVILCSMGLFSPFPLPRYKNDVQWILSLLSFILWAVFLHNCKRKNWGSFMAVCFSIFAIGVCVRLFFFPFDDNYAEYYDNTVPQAFWRVVLPFFRLS